MKKCFLFFLLCVSIKGWCQLPVSPQAIFDIIRQNSVFSAANWDSTNTAFQKKLLAARNAQDSLQSIVYVFEMLNDYHSQLIYNNQVYANYPTFTDSAMAILGPLVNLSYQENTVTTFHFSQQHITYLRIPGIMASGNDINTWAQQIHNALCVYEKGKEKGFIVDLRLNGGGQLACILGGLCGLFPQGPLVYGMDASLQTSRLLENRHHQFFIGDYQAAAVKLQCNDYANVPVAVLIGPVTRSSGSIAAIAFKGRPHTLVLGMPTAAGYSTSNNYLPLAEHMLLNLATEYNADVHGTVYKESVTPHQYYWGPADYANPANDSTVQRALHWLTEQP